MIKYELFFWNKSSGTISAKFLFISLTEMQMKKFHPFFNLFLVLPIAVTSKNLCLHPKSI